MASAKSSVFLAGLGGALLGAVIVSGVGAGSRDEPVRRVRDVALEREIHSLRSALDALAETAALAAERRAPGPLLPRPAPLFPDAAGEEGIVEDPAAWPKQTLAKLAAAPKNTELLLRLAHHSKVAAAREREKPPRETWADLTGEYRLMRLRDILARFGSPDHFHAAPGGARYLQVVYYYRVGKRLHHLKFLLHDRLVVYAGAR